MFPSEKELLWARLDRDDDMTGVRGGCINVDVKRSTKNENNQWISGDPAISVQNMFKV